MIVYLLGKVLLKLVAFITVFIRNIFASVWDKFYELQSQMNWNGVGFASRFIDKTIDWNLLVYGITTAVLIILVVKVLRLIVGLISKG